VKESRAEVREERKQGVQFPGHTIVKVAMQRHPAMLSQNHMSSSLSCQTGTARNLQTHCRRKRTGAPPPDRCRQRTLEPTPPVPGMPPAQTFNTSGAQHFQIVNLPAGDTFSNTALPRAEISTMMNLPRIASTIQTLIQIC
jgi:hypothetical protein